MSAHCDKVYQATLATNQALISAREFFLGWKHADYAKLGIDRHDLRSLFKDKPCNIDLAGFKVHLTGQSVEETQAVAVVRNVRYFWSLWDMPTGVQTMTMVRMVKILMDASPDYISQNATLSYPILFYSTPPCATLLYYVVVVPFMPTHCTCTYKMAEAAQPSVPGTLADAMQVGMMH